MLYKSTTPTTLDALPPTVELKTIMSTLGYSVMDIPSKEVAFYVNPASLLSESNVDHAVVLALYPSEVRFYTAVGYLACAIGESGATTVDEVMSTLPTTIEMMLGYLTDTLFEGTVDHGLAALNRVHVLRCAIALGRFIPPGIWSNIQCVSIQPEWVIFRGQWHAGDYR